MEDWRYTALSITKYNPSFRDERGIYEREEWTSFWDIGKTYNNEIFTLEEYLETEQKHIKAIELIMQLTKCPMLCVQGLEKYQEDNDINIPENKELLPYYKAIKNDYNVTLNDLQYIVKLVLRELCWFELRDFNKDLFIRFGYDYELSINTLLEKQKLAPYIHDIGLYIE